LEIAPTEYATPVCPAQTVELPEIAPAAEGSGVTVTLTFPVIVALQFGGEV
jgi:hypothetical protein